MLKFARPAVVGLVIMSATGIGCGNKTGGGSDIQPQEIAVREVADMIRATTKADGRGPGGIGDFDKLEANMINGYRAVKSGDVVVVWGVGVKGEGQMASGGEVVAYEKNAPTAGGYVVLTGGDVKKLSAADFNATPKAAGKK